MAITQSIWPEIDKGENKVKFESVLAGIPNISQVGVSASFADTECDKKDDECKRIITSASTRSADALNDKIGSEQPIAYV